MSSQFDNDEYRKQFMAGMERLDSIASSIDSGEVVVVRYEDVIYLVADATGKVRATNEPRCPRCAR